MANITRAQLDKFNKALHNGFTLDLQHFIFHSGEKQAAKKVDLGEGKYLQATIGWYRAGDLWSRETIYTPKLHLAIFSPCSTEGVFSSSGMGALISLTEEVFTRRNWNKLAEYTAAWTDEKLLDAMREIWGSWVILFSTLGLQLNRNAGLSPYNCEGNGVSAVFFIFLLAKVLFPL